VPLLGGYLAAATGLEPTAAQLVLSLAGASLAVPGQRWLRPRVEQRFLPERRALERALARTDLAAAEYPAPPLTRLGETLARLLEPDACVVYGRGGDRLVPVFATGPSIAPWFEARGALAELLAERAAPADRAVWRRWTRRRPLSPGDRAALESMGPELLLPLRWGSELAGLVCLGAKRSGDIYTSTEQGWLAALAERASGALARLDDGTVLRESQALQQALRGYVPEAVARELAQGRELTPSEREVSVLFADLRGYTAYAHGRPAREIFSTVNQYTQAVSGVVRAHGGSVVEFHGDGLMAVFGAPGELPHKERAALRAACEIVAAVAGLGVARPDGTPLSVGVGVATGTAFVGSLESVERRIWSAIGNTTNLAARLQSLTRDLDVAVAIDEATWRAVGPDARGFARRPRVRIRGRGDPEDVYVLALAPEEAGS
jgi:class 3 adenylate cyclase